MRSGFAPLPCFGAVDGIDATLGLRRGTSGVRLDRRPPGICLPVRNLGEMTRRPVDRRSFLAVWLLGVAGVAASVPYLFRSGVLDPAALPLSPALAVAVTIAQTAALLAVATWIGLSLGPAVGLRTPFLDAALGDHPMPDPRPVVAQSLGMGAVAGALVLALDRFAFAGRVAVGSSLAGTPTEILGVGVLAAFAGGTYEEILLRFGAMTLVVWTLWRLRPGPDGMPRPWMQWTAVALTAALFALGHLPATAQLAALTPAVIVRALVLDGLPGALFGWLYWKGGLEAAMIAHFGAGLVLHVGGAFL